MRRVPSARTFDPRLRIAYLGAVTGGALVVPGLWGAVALCALQVALWFAVGLPRWRLTRQLAKLGAFGLFIVASYALTAGDPASDRWREVPLGGLTLSLNAGGAAIGVLMALRILAVVLASQVARAGDPRAIATGLDRLGLPRIASASIDTVLALLGDLDRPRHGRGSGGGMGGGGGGGGGGGRGRRGGALAEPGTGDDLVPEDEGRAARGRAFWAALQRLSRGDVAPLVARLEGQIGRAERAVAAQDLGERGAALARDVAVIAGVALTMLGIKALKILPSIPFAPGHKLVLLTPLYIAASLLTRSPAGATLTGLTMGTVAFLMGDGRYGIFEILKHVVPGVLCDLGTPLITGGGRQPGPFAWSLFGGVIAAGRFATIVAIILVAQAPAIAYAIVAPGMVVHVTFGVLSGYVSYQLVRAIEPLRAATPLSEGTVKKEIA